jgi:hypothetical protein
MKYEENVSPNSVYNPEHQTYEREKLGHENTVL